jgi:hypothetical protein
MTPEQIEAEIEQLETLLNSGATSVTSDGETVNLSQEDIRRRLLELKARQSGRRHTARRVRTFDMRNAF